MTKEQAQEAKKAVYRRKIEPSIDPGEGYRLLDQEEFIEKGDEFFHVYYGQWRPTSCPDTKVSDKGNTSNIYRRKLKESEYPSKGFQLSDLSIPVLKPTYYTLEKELSRAEEKIKKLEKKLANIRGIVETTKI